MSKVLDECEGFLCVKPPVYVCTTCWMFHDREEMHRHIILTGHSKIKRIRLAYEKEVRE